MAIRTIQKADRALTPQPFHDKLNSIKTVMQQRYHFNPMLETGFNSVLSSESMVEQIGQTVAELIPDEQSRENYLSIYENTMREVVNPFAAFSQEGADAMAPNSNYNQFARLNPWTILGYIARSKALEMFHTINHDQPTVTYEYNLSYVVKGSDPTRYILPNAARDGSLQDLFTLPQLSVDLDLVGVGGFEHLASLNTGPAAAAEGWVSVPSKGNLLTEAGSEYDPAKYAIERNVSISRVYWKVRNEADTADITGTVDVYADRHLMTGEISNRMFHYPITVTYDDAGTAKSFSATLMGVLNLDTGEYELGATSAAITHIQFDARVTNLANELGTVRAGNTKIVETFDVNNRNYGTVPISPEMSDDFNAGGEGVSFVAFMVDKVTEAFANVRDLDMESSLDASFSRGPENHKLYPKLGGSKQTVSFPLAARGAGGGDPFSWQTIGLKNTLNHVLTAAETDTYFEDNIPRQWFILGHEIDTQRIPDVQYTNYGGDAGDGGAGSGAAGGNFKYGFALDSSSGYADNFGRRVKVIGSKYRRHYQKPMRAVLKSATIEQPTTVYFPYSFRVFSGISPEYRNRPALTVAARDYIGSLSCVQARVTLTGNTADLYENLSTFSAGK